jgi:hypothetical protein
VGFRGSESCRSSIGLLDSLLEAWPKFTHDHHQDEILNLLCPK